jgi:N-acylneuraminate cytidylyltransferase
MSDESGIGTLNTIKDSKFGSTFTQNRILLEAQDEVFAWAKKADASMNLTKSLVILLQNTSPFRKSEHLKEAIKLYTPDVDMVVSVKECAANPYYCVFEEDAEGYLHICKGDGNIFRRQDAPKVFEYNGAIYIMNVETLKTTHMHKMKKRVKYVMDEMSSFDLDTMTDWRIAEMIKQEGSI